jgi:hypothetical protein
MSVALYVPKTGRGIGFEFFRKVHIGPRMSDPFSVSRRLVAVFAADVEGYTCLMGADEVGTLKGLTEWRAILDRLIGDHRGHIRRGEPKRGGAHLAKSADMR